MRIRTIKPEFCTSESTASVSLQARLLFVLMWCFCDDAGVHPDSAMRLKMECFPADPISLDEVRGWVDELVGAGLLVRYEAEGTTWLRVVTWDRHQKIEKPTFRFPTEAGGKSPTGQRVVADKVATGRRQVAEKSESEHREVVAHSTPESSLVESSRETLKYVEDGVRNSDSESSQSVGRSRASKSYAFQGVVVRLLPKDYDTWRNTFSSIQNLDAELRAADAWLVDNPPSQAKWFSFVARWLKKANDDQARAEREAAAPAPKRRLLGPDDWHKMI
jgi:hypothetical protein